MNDTPFTKQYTERDFPEDADQENGNYERECVSCGKSFVGNKHRTTCKSCKQTEDAGYEVFPMTEDDVASAQHMLAVPKEDLIIVPAREAPVKGPDPAFCHHEPNLDAKVYHKTGWRAPCSRCGIMLDIQPRLVPDPRHKPKVHMSKKERLMRRKMPLFVKEEKTITNAIVKPIMSRRMRRMLHEK